VRVIAGKYKRRLLKTLPGTDVTRPTSDRVKESLFNMLAPELGAAIVWDLFAGSGALGIEALSRGAQHVTFVEESSAAVRMIQDNLKTLGVSPENYAVVNQRVDLFLRNLSSKKAADAAKDAPLLSVVLADPPYDSSWYDESLKALADCDACGNGCLVVLEMRTGRQLPEPDFNTWELEDERTYGIAQLQFWRFRRFGG